MTVGVHPPGVPTRGIGGSRWSPTPRIGYEVLVAWTRTGQVIGALPAWTSADWTDPVAWSQLGTMNVTAPLLGRGTPEQREQRDVLRLLARENLNLSLILVRTLDRRAMWAGPMTSFDWSPDAVKIACSSIAKLYDSRILIANDYWGLPNDSRGTLTFNKTNRDLALELLTQGIVGYRRDLPIEVPPQSNTEGDPITYKPDDLVTNYEGIKKIVEQDDGPDVILTPELYETEAGQWLRWVAEVGNPLVGSAALWTPSTRVPVFDWQAGLLELAGSIDASEMVSTGYVVGDSIGTSERRRIIGVRVIDRGDPLPALERADRTNTSSVNVGELNALARSYVAVHAYPTHEWTVEVDADQWPLLGVEWRKGDMIKLAVSDHYWLPDGEYLRRIVGVSGSTDDRLKLTTTDGSEAGAPRWLDRT